MNINDNTIKAIIMAYNSNKMTLKDLNDSRDAGLDLGSSYEEGYNDALEYVLERLGIEVE